MDSYNDLSPRVGVAYDLFGNGKTALKANVGKYLEGAGIQLNFARPESDDRLPGTGLPRTATRTWIDANNNFQPDCDLLSPTAQDLRASGRDLCGALSNARFGQPVFTNTYDEELLHGWGVRSSDWGIGVSVQQEIVPRVSAEIAYHRRWFRGFTVTDNLFTQPSDYTEYSITAPLDPRLPDGRLSRSRGVRRRTRALRAGRRLHHGFARVRRMVAMLQRHGRHGERAHTRGLTVQGGMSVGQTVSDACDVRAQLPELSVNIGAGLQGSNVSQTSPYCHVATGFLTQFRGWPPTRSRRSSFR